MITNFEVDASKNFQCAIVFGEPPHKDAGFRAAGVGFSFGRIGRRGCRHCDPANAAPS
jgi:hypothetical protein